MQVFIDKFENTSKRIGVILKVNALFGQRLQLWRKLFCGHPNEFKQSASRAIK